MRPIIDSNDREFLEQLRPLGAVTVRQLCEAMDVTATAVRQRLSRLVTLGLVSRERARLARGRPHYLYKVAETGLRELGDNYADLAMNLWASLRSIEDPSVRKQVLERVEQTLVSQYGKTVDGTTLRERFDQLRAALAAHGFDVEIDESGDLPILREKNCPYHELASSDPAICELEQAVFRQILGTDVALSQCCLDGHVCCEFQTVEEQAV